MRSNEERVAEVKRRMEQKKRQEEMHRGRIVMVTAVAASLLFIAGLSALMPGIASQISTDYSHYGMTASIFHNSSALSYIIIGLVAFILGVCVTILGVRIHHLNKEQQSAGDKGDEEDGAD